jgi:hypothetical protein
MSQAFRIKVYDVRIGQGRYVNVSRVSPANTLKTEK